MLYAFLANLVLIFHATYIVFAVLGGLLALRWPRVWMLHAPAVLWALLVEILMLDCPLTALENGFRAASGQAGYERGFIDHFISSIIYPGLPPESHILLGVLLALLNVGIYFYLFRKNSLTITGRTYEA